jgi:hypothetical protein
MGLVTRTAVAAAVALCAAGCASALLVKERPTESLKVPLGPHFGNSTAVYEGPFEHICALHACELCPKSDCAPSRQARAALRRAEQAHGAQAEPVGLVCVDDGDGDLWQRGWYLLVVRGSPFVGEATRFPGRHGMELFLDTPSAVRALGASSRPVLTSKGIALGGLLAFEPVSHESKDRR